MQNDADASDAAVAEEVVEYVSRNISRVLRAVGYTIVAWILVLSVDYSLKNEIAVVLSIGLLGLFTSSAKIGQLGLALLLVMALISPEIVDGVKF